MSDPQQSGEQAIERLYAAVSDEVEPLVSAVATEYRALLKHQQILSIALLALLTWAEGADSQLEQEFRVDNWTEPKEFAQARTALQPVHREAGTSHV